MSTTLNRSPFTAINSTIVHTIIRQFNARIVMPLASTFAPGWTVKTVAQQFITPPHIPHTGREKRALASGVRSTVASPMGSLVAWRFGRVDAPAIIVSHGWGGRGAQFREFVPALVSAGYAVWLFDHFSHGLSAGNEAVITDFSRGVTAITRHAQRSGDRVVGFLGHSLGCAGIGIALRTELADMQHIKVIQIAPPASLIRASRFFARAFGIPERIRAAMQWRLEQRIGVAWQSFEMPEAVASLRAQALIIHDSDDTDVRIESGLSVANAWPDARFMRTTGLGHRRVLRDRRVVSAAVDFLDGKVEFPHPPAPDQWSRFQTSIGSAAPLY